MANQLGSTCLEVSMVLRKIFEYLTTTELLDLSLVNKAWNYEVRSVLKHRGSLTAALRHNQPCRDLAAFASVLKQMNVVPITGIRIYFDEFCHVNDKCEGSSLSSHSTILEQVQWKHMSLQFKAYPLGCDDCPGIMLAKKILESNCGTLEEISIHFSIDKGESFKETVQVGEFTRLKTLKLGPLPRPYCTGYSSFIKTLVSRAPNLKEVFAVEAIRFTENVLEGSKAVFYVTEEFSPSRWKYPETFPALRLNELNLDDFSENYSSVQFNSNIPALLKSSQLTLTCLTIDLVLAVPLMTYGICLENVKKLTIIMNKRSSELVKPFLQVFNFKQMFPILTAVHIRSQEYQNAIPEELIGDFIGQGHAMLMDPAAQDRAINIKHIYLCRAWEDFDDFGFFGAVFPDVEKISVSELNHPRIHKGPIFENWPRLKELEIITEIDYPHMPSIQNLDSAFCGIFPEEVEELREMDDEYLKAVHIVPVMPSIGCMRGLKSLTLGYIDPIYHLVQNDYSELGDKMGVDPTFIFSKVACLVGFARCKNLSVTFRTNVVEIFEGLEHMYPHATFCIEPFEFINGGGA